MSKSEISILIVNLTNKIEKHSEQISKLSNKIKHCQDELMSREEEHYKKISNGLKGRLKSRAKVSSNKETISSMYNEGKSISEICITTNLSRSSVYKYIRDGKKDN